MGVLNGQSLELQFRLRGRGLAFGDLNNDGWMDAVITVLGGHSCSFDESRRQAALADKSRCRAVEATETDWAHELRVNGQTRFATSSGSYLSANDKRLHFGLGDAVTAEVEVRWPFGNEAIVEGREGGSIFGNKRSGAIVIHGDSIFFAELAGCFRRRRAAHARRE